MRSEERQALLVKPIGARLVETRAEPVLKRRLRTSATVAGPQAGALTILVPGIAQEGAARAGPRAHLACLLHARALALITSPAET